MRIRILTTTLLTILLTSCFIRLAYNHLDWILIWEIDNYFNLNAQQEELLKHYIQRQLVWHRQQEVQRYVDLLSTTKKKAGDGLSLDEIDWFFASLQSLKASLVNRLAVDAAKFLATVTKEQTQYLQTALSEENEKLAEQLDLTAQQRLDRRAEQIVDFTERWLGELSEQQVEYITKLSHQLPDNAVQWLEYRQKRQQRFTEIVRSASVKDVSKMLREWFLEQPPDKFSAYRNQVKKMILDIDNIITSTQRAHLVDELDDLIDEIQTILPDGRQKSVRIDQIMESPSNG